MEYLSEKNATTVEEQKDAGTVSTPVRARQCSSPVKENTNKCILPEDEVEGRTEEHDQKTKPDRTASFAKDEADHHRDQLPWLLGAVSRLLHIEMAPLSIPRHRRMETLATLLWMSIFLFMGIIATYLLIYIFLYTQYWWVTLCYVSWYIPDRTICNRGGRRIHWVRKWKIWKHFRNFFPVHVIKTAELDSNHNYIMGYHPHGLLCAGAFSTFATEGTNFSELFPGLTPYLLTLEVFHYLPFYRELFSCSGSVSASKSSMDYLLGSTGTGKALCLVVGGAPEALECHPGQIVLHLERRMGFIKMALRHGASLVPMFAFGENEIYDQVANPPGSLVRRVQDKMQQIFKIPPCLFMGRGIFQYSFGIIPFRKPIYVVIGSPIHVNPVRMPTSEQILALHAEYKQALCNLYNTYKETYASDPSLGIHLV